MDKAVEMKKLYILLVLVFVLPGIVNAQRYKNRWKSYRSELHFGVGPSNFLGELGGADQIGTDFFRDLEINQTRLAVSGGLRYKLNPVFALNTKITYCKVSGDDELTKEFFRNYRNLNFKTNIWEVSTNLEFAFIKEQVGHRYRLRGVRGQKGYEFSLYGFVGAGFFYFNPKGQHGEEWVDLHELGTEGQGVSSTREEYSKFQFCVPLGLGVKYALDRRWSIGLEYGIRKTFTDYIDDASKTYYDNASLAMENGALAADMADKSE